MQTLTFAEKQSLKLELEAWIRRGRRPKLEDFLRGSDKWEGLIENGGFPLVLDALARIWFDSLLPFVDISVDDFTQRCLGRPLKLEESRSLTRTLYI